MAQGPVVVEAQTNTDLIALFTALRPKLQRYLAARFRDEVFAEDVLQDMYLKLDRLSLSAAVHNAEAYLYQMANRQALDQRKQAARQQNRDHDWYMHQALLHGHISTSGIGEDSAEHVLLRAAIDALPPKAKAVFIAHKIEGLPHKTVAARYNISLSTVEKHIRRAMRHIVDYCTNTADPPPEAGNDPN